MFKSGFVAIIGEPNVGKSTLINKILNHKVAITSNKVQTTRTNIKAIFNDHESQIIFIDTPGIHHPLNALQKMMVQNAWGAIKDCELVLLIVDGNAKFSVKTQQLLQKVLQNAKLVFVVISKCDLISKNKVLATIDLVKDFKKILEIVPVSAQTNFNIDLLLKLIKNVLPKGKKYFNENIIINAKTEFIVSEFIREQVLHKTRQEIPHGIASYLEKLTYDRQKDLWIIEAIILVTKKNHKKIIVGRAGKMIKQISQNARQEISKYLRKKVYLKVFVKVKEKWENNQQFIKIYDKNN